MLYKFNNQCVLLEAAIGKVLNWIGVRFTIF